MNIPAIPVLYGTESGNAEYCAEQLARALKTRGLDARAIDMDDFDPTWIERVSAAAFVTSTYGNGDPPSNARKMLEYLQREDVQLPKLSFAVCGLGDETFHHFAKCGQDFEAALLRAGAAPLTDRVDCDIDFDDSFEDFERATVSALEEQQTTAAATEIREAESNATTPSESVEAPAQSSRVFAATLLERKKLSGIGSNKWTMHYSFDISAAPEPYQVGDCFAIHPTNGPRVIDSVLSALQEETSHPVSWRGQTLPLGEVLAQACLRHVDNALLQTLAKLPRGDERPGGTALADGDDATRRYREERDVLDVLVDNAPHGAAAQDVVQHLRRLAPRMYSVASSPAKNPAAVSLVVETVRYQRRGHVVQGVASNLLATRVELGETVDMHLVPNTAFRFNDSDRPVIMVGPGTGIAPFRAYLEHLEQIHSPQNCRLTWLFFGHQRFSTDFLFQEDIMRWREAGILSRLDLAWSRICLLYTSDAADEARS
ncbi:MAG: sulfite reductase flavoprotein subunit alpha, partial [Nannocystaceae bacterium]|nr:sulfite reductase flavoprotein subunit alpha [Nannocystaceae bacterium]